MEKGYYPEQVLRDFRANESWYSSYLEKYMDDKTETLLVYQGETMEYGKNIKVRNYRDYLLK